MKRVKKQTVKNRKQAAGRRGTSASDSGAINISQSDSKSQYRDPAPSMRFDATIHARQKADPEWEKKLNIDRVPDPKGLVRALVTAADCVRLLDQGFEVRLHQAHPVRPLDPKLIENEEAMKRWLEKKLKEVRRK